MRMGMEYDTAVIGAGPAGLATAIHLKQLARAERRSVSVCILEKGPEVGSRILPGAVFKPSALNELLPDWQAEEALLRTAVSREEVYFFSGPEQAVKIPPRYVPKALHNKGNYIASLAHVCRWLAGQAEALGVDILTALPADDLIIDGADVVRGVGVLAAPTRDADGRRQAGREVRAKYTVFAEGCRGPLGERLIEYYGLGRGSDTQRYGLGLTETWEAPAARHRPGLVLYGGGWPFSESGSSGGFFLFHQPQSRISAGLIRDLNPHNAGPNLAEQFESFKQHPQIRQFLADGRRLSRDSWNITLGGYFSLPKMVMPGAILVGCDAGTLHFVRLSLPPSLMPANADADSLNLALIKGSHTAMKSGMLAAETIFAALAGGGAGGQELDDYYSRFKQSWLHEELYSAGELAGF